ncbi:hypothetical protein [Kineosporia babensis]|uniref:Uncharacterized protein n=1 Tax=Kineosporia babensis TaxID=499548 RepID=A0A9X1NL69_9ACTN|nr:hypothetical protein [Kineosporia babensis]MCD5316350.1 hypothetical protein [Kineosporia babensis]
MVTVVLSLAVLTLFLMVALGFALRGMAPARNFQDDKAAQQAARASIDEFVSLLNANDSYWSQSDAGFSDVKSFKLGGSGSDFTYQRLNTIEDTYNTGLIKLKVTGTTGTPPVTRSFTVELKRNNLLDYLYLSDIEVVDPELLGQPASCANYYYGTSARPRTGCSEIQWSASDIVEGPLHSNDALQINGKSDFRGEATTSYPAAKGVVNGKTWWGDADYPLKDKNPVWHELVNLPKRNDSLLENVSPDVDGDGQTGPGCYYTGATRIVLQGTKMKVLSPSTKRADIPSKCYNVKNAGTEQVVDIPPVIYVARSNDDACLIGQVGYPAANEKYTVGSSSAVSWGTTTNYACTRGTLFISGTADAAVTISGQDDVVLVGDLKVSSTDGNNMIGLIAGNCVWVYHPLRSGSNSNLNLLPSVNNIDAAMLALGHSFVVQNWGFGATLGTLNVNGVIAQKFRGPVGTGKGAVMSTGYAKNYKYDRRYIRTQPPYFLRPDGNPFTLVKLIEN